MQKNVNSAIDNYIEDVQTQYRSGHAKEHAYRPALKTLMSSFENALAVNDPKRSQHGNPDFVFLKKSNKGIILGYAEAKDIDVSLDKIEKTDQMRRYAGYDNLFLTNYLDFRFYKNGNKYQKITIGELKDGEIKFLPENFSHLESELKAFLEQPPETIKSGKRLAQIMGAKARRIRDNVAIYLKHEDSERNAELEKIYKMMQTLLVHDLTPEKFADMYAQTLVYGLFVARYGDTTPENFTRSEARDLVPKSNPFLQKFFDHIVGPDFDSRLSYIVDELCEIFSVSDVAQLVHKHLKILEDADEKDPIIHFYEDFLNEYDPLERKKMGAYYTPVPVVKFIVRNVDEILKKEFGITKGLADSQKKTIGTYKHSSRQTLHRVQILDPAVGTATFLNETIKHIYKDFKDQQGRWESYVKEDLLPRMYGFELMMAPYTIAHLKLGMTLQETGVKDLQQRLGLYLTNTLEEGTKNQQDIFSFGLAEEVSKEAAEAAKIKQERPIMVIIGNPPYSISSNNKSEYIQNLIKDYKKDLNERKINLDDDYIKFIRFAEEMINKNGEGIVAMITNNSFIDGITHRQMRKHLLETFDDIYILDLHGNSIKKETAPDGSKDENVFDIQQGVGISIYVKKSKKASSGKIHFAELCGRRKEKFNKLNGKINWQTLAVKEPYYFFVPKDFKLESLYENGISINDIFLVSNSGVKTDRDTLFIDKNKIELKNRISNLLSGDYDSSFKTAYRVVDSGSYKLTERLKQKSFNEKYLQPIQYRPFDYQWIYYDPTLISRPAEKVLKHIVEKENIALISSRQYGSGKHFICFITKIITEISSQPYAPYMLYPLYLYHDDGTRTPNFKPEVLKQFTQNLNREYEAEAILDYIYAVLYSPKYREEYKEFLKIDFPRIPAPKSDVDFKKLGALGRQLRELHLMTSPILNKLSTTYPVAGSNVVEKVQYWPADTKTFFKNDKNPIIHKANSVQISNDQYFGNVPEVAWNFYIGGYQPAQKWLKDRKGRKLSNEDIEHYQKIIKVLIETDKVMQRIDHIKR